MKYVLSLLILCGTALCLQAGSEKPTFNLRFHLEATGSASPNTSIPIALRNPEQMIKIEKYAFLSEKQIEGMQLMPDGSALIELTDMGKKIMQTTTSNSLGRVMVVFCNGRVVYAPEIDTVLKEGRIIIPSGVTDLDVQAFKSYALKRQRS